MTPTLPECECFAPIETARRWCSKCDRPMPKGAPKFTPEEIRIIADVAASYEKDDAEGDFWERLAAKMREA